jgi:hypothetical protein
MKSIERRFKRITKRNPYWSSYVCFWSTVRYQRFTKKTISIWFNKLVDKDDYSKSDKKACISHMMEATNEPYEGKK